MSPAADFINARPRGDTTTDVVAVEIDLVGAYDAHHSLRSRGIGIAHGRPEECPVRRLPRSRSFRVHDFRGFDSLREKANPPIDLPQPPLAVLIVGVFTAIAVAGSPRHHLRHGRAFPGEQKPVLILEALQPAPRYVVLDWRRGLVRLWFSRKPFSHLVVLPSENSWRGQLFVVKERLNRFAILINPLRADEPRLAKNSIDPIRNPNCAICPTPTGTPLVPGLRCNLKHLSLCSFAA